MSFKKHSNFNEQANFTEVNFGENMPVLEVELNEMQQIQNEARASIIRDSIPSGFVTLGDIDYDYCATHPNQILLKTESVAYVHGYRVTIPLNTIIEIGESDKVRDDLVFLEVWKEYVNELDTLTQYGGENNAEIKNNIKDERYPVATSRRVALKYRIRHVADVDFQTYTMDGFTKYHSGVEGFKYNNEKVVAQANNETPLAPSVTSRYINFNQRKHFNSNNYQTHSTIAGVAFDDYGLFVAMGKDLKTVDGYVYAIPMFKLKRKPNVGLASPFEYTKIHPQISPKDLSNVVNSSHVEKSSSVYVEGEVIKNYVLKASTLTPTSDSKGTYYNMLTTSGLKRGVQYTYIVTNVPKGIYYYLGQSTGDVLVHKAKHTNKNYIAHTFTVNTDFYESGKQHLSPHFYDIPPRSGIENAKFYILEGDWTSREIPNMHDYGLIYTGKNDNKVSITNNVLKEGMYCTDTKTNNLPSINSDVTHAFFNHENSLIPEIEIDVKKGDTTLKTVTQLPIKLDTPDNENLVIKKLKGNTLINLYSKLDNTQKTQWQPNSYLKTELLKPNTTYTIQIENLTTEEKLIYCNEEYFTDANHITITSKNTVKILRTTKSEITSTSGVFLKNAKTHSQNMNLKIVLIEGSHADTSIPYFEGMTSVSSPSIKITGKNIFDLSRMNEVGHAGNGISNIIDLENNTISTTNSNNGVSGRGYVMTGLKKGVAYTVTATLDSTSETSGYVQIGNRQGGSYHEQRRWFDPGKTISWKVYSDVGKLNIAVANTGVKPSGMVTFRDIQIEESDTASTVERYKTYDFNLPKNLSLRGIGNVKDEFDLETGQITERICEETLDGTEYWDKIYGANGLEYFRYIPASMKKDNVLYNDKLPLLDYATQFYQGTSITGNAISTTFSSEKQKQAIYIYSDGITDVEAFKEWLSNNPVTVQYIRDGEVKTNISYTDDDYKWKSKITYQLNQPLLFGDSNNKDFIKDNILYKNLNIVTFDGDENISLHSSQPTNTDLVRFRCPLPSGKHDNRYVYYCDRFDVVVGSFSDLNEIGISSNTGLYQNEAYCYIVVSKTVHGVTNVNEFKTWLSKNPVTVVYKSGKPKTYHLSEVHHNQLTKCDLSDMPSNSYVGDLYITKGTNCIETEATNFDIYTPNNLFNQKYNLVEHCNVKKSPYGHPIIPTSLTENLHDDKLYDGMGFYQSGGILNFKDGWITSVNTFQVEKGKTYYVTLTANDSSITDNRRYIYVYKYDLFGNYLGTRMDVGMKESFTSDFDGFARLCIRTMEVSHIQVTEGKKIDEQVKHHPSEMIFEGIEKHEIEDLRHRVSLTGFDYTQLLQDSFLKLIKGELS